MAEKDYFAPVVAGCGRARSPASLLALRPVGFTPERCGGVLCALKQICVPISLHEIGYCANKEEGWVIAVEMTRGWR